MNRPVNHVLSKLSQTQSQTPHVFSYVEGEEEILPEQEGGKGGQWKTCDMRAERTLQRKDGPAGGAWQGSEGRRHLDQTVIDTCLKIMEPMTLYANLKLILKETYVNEINMLEHFDIHMQKRTCTNMVSSSQWGHDPFHT